MEGLARAGARGRCTPMGRSAMSLDLQGLQRGLQNLSARSSDSVVNAMRIVDAYIKAYYIPWGPELHRWAITHPEYTQVSNQLACKVITIGDPGRAVPQYAFTNNTLETSLALLICLFAFEHWEKIKKNFKLVQCTLHCLRAAFDDHDHVLQDQLFALVNCIAESNNLRRREKAVLMSEIENDLKILQ